MFQLFELQFTLARTCFFWLLIEHMWRTSCTPPYNPTALYIYIKRFLGHAVWWQQFDTTPALPSEAQKAINILFCSYCQRLLANILNSQGMNEKNSLLCSFNYQCCLHLRRTAIRGPLKLPYTEPDHWSFRFSTVYSERQLPFRIPSRGLSCHQWLGDAGERNWDLLHTKQMLCHRPTKMDSTYPQYSQLRAQIICWTTGRYLAK